ncbi:MAG: recombination protein NinG [Bacteroidia bacterium]|nr:recombination protein NinG [Bacteroidia bacterium]
MIKFRKRKCRKCGNQAVQNRALCYQCILADKRKKAEAKLLSKAKKKARFEQGETYRKRLFKKAWELQSKAMRQAAADENGNVKCYTCLKVMRWQDSMIGHYFHGKLDFDERNLRIQGACCNTYRHGNLAIYAERLVEEGIDLKQLRRDAEIKGNAYSISELKEIIENYSSPASRGG